MNRKLCPDYRTQLLPWSECKYILQRYCSAVGLPKSAGDFVKTLRRQFIELAQRVDDAPTNESDLYFDADGKPHLHQLTRLPAPEDAEKLEAIMKSQLPERHLLDVLHNVEHWEGYIRNFGPPSGSDPKLRDPLSRYLITVWTQYRHRCNQTNRSCRQYTWVSQWCEFSDV